MLLLTGNVAFGEIIRVQQEGPLAFGWFVLPLFLSFFVFLVSGFAETNRLPFDMPEAESELIAGYHTEYSAMKFSMFFIAEYANMVTVSAMVTTLFFGGWDIPFTHWDEIPGVAQTVATGLVMFLKVFCFLFLFMWIRWTLPRFRYDQLMALGWKILLPISLCYIMVIATAMYLLESVLGLTGWAARTGVLTLISLALGYVVFVVLDRGLLISGSRARTGSGASLTRAA